MNDSASMKSLPAAVTTIVPSRTPVAAFCKIWRHCRQHRLYDARFLSVLGSPPTLIDHAVPTTSASLAFADVQIPIAPRLC